MAASYNPLREMWQDMVVHARTDADRGAGVVFVVVAGLVVGPILAVLWGLGRVTRLFTGRR